MPRRRRGGLEAMPLAKRSRAASRQLQTRHPDRPIGKAPDRCGATIVRLWR
jgi:hypothetical protein